MKFSIEYYPRTNVWVAKRGPLYLEKNYFTGIVTASFTDWVFGGFGIIFATKCESEKEAMNIIDLYKEQRFKKSIIKKNV